MNCFSNIQIFNILFLVSTESDDSGAHNNRTRGRNMKKSSARATRARAPRASASRSAAATNKREVSKLSKPPKTKLMETPADVNMNTEDVLKPV